MNRPEPMPKRATRIQLKNRKAILDAALEVFAASGFRGATIDRIAGRAGLSKPNLLYYFPSKEAIYRALLEDTLAAWLKPLEDLDPAGDPIEEIGRYIDAKLEMSRTRPEASKLFANEILHGAPAIGDFLRGPMKALIDEKAAVIEGWIARRQARAGRSAPPDHDDLGDDPALRGFRRAGARRARRYAAKRASRTASRALKQLFFEGLRPKDLMHSGRRRRRSPHVRRNADGS